MRALIGFLLLVSSFASFAYIPDYNMIISRTSENHGRGIYSLEQELVFPNENALPTVVKEKWLIQDEDYMRLNAVAKVGTTEILNLTFVYRKGQRYFLNANGIRKVGPTGESWFEPYFVYRYSKRIKPQIVAHEIAPSTTLKSRPRVTDLKKLEYADESAFLRLSRAAGVVTYGIGKPSPAKSTDLLPGLWIEQDRFVIRKLRLPDSVEVRADKYQKYSRGFWAPRLRTIIYPEGRVEAHIRSVKALAKTKKTLAKFNPKSLDFAKSPELATKWPEDARLRDFYSRFR